MKTLARQRLETPAGHAMLFAVQSKNDPLVSIYARYWPKGSGIDDAPEVRCRCKADQWAALWEIALAQVQMLMGM